MEEFVVCDGISADIIENKYKQDNNLFHVKESTCVSQASFI